MNFNFLHCADLHLDSPLIGLGHRSREFAERVDNASRQAFDNLIALAMEAECRFVLISGDVFDGEWRDYGTGLFFADRMRRLRDVGINVYMILGNHDAENRFAGRLDLSDNVYRLSHKKPESVALEELGVVIHGRSFPQRDVTENLALGYPAPVPGRFNIGILHTACSGRDGHAPYAPCSVAQLVSHGYDYWALGHVHTREVLSSDPYIVFPGNLQGRNSRETGAKGATVVSVADRRVVSITHCPLDILRWESRQLDVAAAENVSAVYALARLAFEQACDASDGRALALRLTLKGETSLHHELVAKRAMLSEEIETIAASVSGDLWIDGCEVATTSPPREAGIDPSIAGELRRAVEDLSNDDLMTKCLERTLNDLRLKMPARANRDEFFAELRAEVPRLALENALSLIEPGDR